MNRILAALLLLALSFPASAEVRQARYGVAETFGFNLYNADGTLDVDEADGGTEVSLSCDEGAETTATNDFVDEGTSYSIALTAAELKCERVAVVIAATTTEVFHIQTSALDAGVVAYGTAQSATGTTIVLAAATSFADDFLNCRTILITGGTGAGQAKSIDDWVSATDTATVSTWTTNPDSTSVYEVYGTACATGSVSIATGGIVAGSFAAGAIDAAAIAADAIGASELATDAIGAAELAANSITSSEVADGAIDAGAFASDAITAAKVAADVTTELQTGLATSAALATVDGIVDTIVATTNQITFTVAGQVDANTESMNAAAVCGDGTDGTPWADCP
jgi:hypothetical protein